jgi:hypothetical protein
MCIIKLWLKAHTLMATSCPFIARLTGLLLISTEAMRPISIKSWEGIQIGVPICKIKILVKV